MPTNERSMQECKEISMKTYPTLKLTTLAAILSTGFLIACSDSSQQTAGQKLDKSVAMAQQKGEELKSDMKQGASDLKDQASAMTSDAKQTMGDATISAEINASIAKDAALSVMKIDVDTKQGMVTLSGTAPDAAARTHATELAQAVDGVKTVDNQLVIKPQ